MRYAWVPPSRCPIRRHAIPARALGRMQMSDSGLDLGRITVHRKGSGPALVLLHCLGVDHRLWDIAAAGLERDFTLLTYDFPGHGATPVPPQGYGVAQLSAQLARLLEREGIGRAHLAASRWAASGGSRFTARAAGRRWCCCIASGSITGCGTSPPPGSNAISP